MPPSLLDPLLPCISQVSQEATGHQEAVSAPTPSCHQVWSVTGLVAALARGLLSLPLDAPHTRRVWVFSLQGEALPSHLEGGGHRSQALRPQPTPVFPAYVLSFLSPVPGVWCTLHFKQACLLSGALTAALVQTWLHSLFRDCRLRRVPGLGPGPVPCAEWCWSGGSRGLCPDSVANQKWIPRRCPPELNPLRSWLVRLGPQVGATPRPLPVPAVPGTVCTPGVLCNCWGCDFQIVGW